MIRRLSQKVSTGRYNRASTALRVQVRDREAKNVSLRFVAIWCASADAAPFAVLVERLVDGVPVETAVGEKLLSSVAITAVPSRG